MSYQATKNTCLTVSYQELANMVPREISDLEHLVESGVLRHAQVKDPETGEFVTKIAFYSSTVPFVRGLLQIKESASSTQQPEYAGSYKELFQLDPNMPLGDNWVRVSDYTQDNQERQKLYQASYARKIPFFKHGSNHVITKQDAARVLGKSSFVTRLRSLLRLGGKRYA